MRYEDGDIRGALKERLLRELGTDTKGKSLKDASFEALLKLSKEKDLLDKQLGTLLSDKVKLTRARFVTFVIKQIGASRCEKQLLRCLQVKYPVPTPILKGKIDCIDLKSLKARLNSKLKKKGGGCQIVSFRKGKLYFYQLDITITLKRDVISRIASNKQP